MSGVGWSGVGRVVGADRGVLGWKLGSRVALEERDQNLSFGHVLKGLFLPLLTENYTGGAR